MSTVGYGDFSPKTPVGRILTGFAMVAGLLVISMPLAIVGNNFTEAWETRTLTLIGERLRQIVVKNGLANTSRKGSMEFAAFRIFDKNGEGSFNYNTFKRVMKLELQIEIPNWRTKQAWDSLDIDEGGSVDFVEFCTVVFPDLDGEDVRAVLCSESPNSGYFADDGLNKNKDMDQVKQIVLSLADSVRSSHDRLQESIEKLEARLDGISQLSDGQQGSVTRAMAVLETVGKGTKSMGVDKLAA